VRLPGPLRVHLLTAGLLTVGAVLYGTVVRSLPAAPAPVHLPWPVLAAGFAATTVFAVHLEFRRHAHSFALSELPLVTGLYLLAPPELVLARMVGSAAALILHRRQAPTKLAFNLALFLLETCLAVTVFQGLRGGHPLAPRGWAAALLAALTVDLVSALVIAAAISLYEGASQWRMLLEVAATGAVAAVANTSLALVAVLTLVADLRAAGLLLAVAAVLLLAYRGYGSLRQRHHHPERLYDFTRTVTSSPEVDKTVRALLEQAASLLRAEAAELLLHDPAGGGARLVRLAGDGGGIMEARPPGPTDPLFEVPGGATAIYPKPIGDPGVRAEAARRGLQDAVVAALPGADRPLGALLVGNRLGDVSTFDEEDAKLLEALANQASVALEKAWLIDRLRVEAVERSLQAAHDALTGLGNRRWFLEELAEAIGARPAGGFAVLLLDLDRFKEVNDTLGHQTGDRLLLEVAERLVTATAGDGLVARLGGDEFGVLLRGTGAPGAAVGVAGRLLAAVAPPMRLDDMDLEVTASVGIACWPEHGDGPDLLLQRADVAMYLAKARHAGIEVYTEARDPSSPDRLALVGELRAAIDAGALTVAYQPKVDAASGRVVGAEALARRLHSTRGMVPPDVFIPIAEHTGLIAPLGRLVLIDALQACRRWRAIGLELGVAVNLSARGLLAAGLVEDVAGLLAAAGLPADALTLEITEDQVMVDSERALGVLAQLRDLGVHLSVDDFGTGYASLGYLRELPVDEVKIDKSFVLGMTANAGDAAIVQAAVTLGHSLGLRVVAEGVEDAETQRRLAAMGCDLIQGYHTGRPMTPEELLRVALRPTVGVPAERST
jgi:diguanylate cyclase (GGDEF)-like protein